MTLNTPFGKDTAPDETLALTERHFIRAIRELDRILKDLETSGEGAPPAVAKAAVDARKAMQTLFDERKRLEQSSKDGSGLAGDSALDLDAARDEIRRRLACLGAAGEARGVPE